MYRVNIVYLCDCMYIIHVFIGVYICWMYLFLFLIDILFGQLRDTVCHAGFSRRTCYSFFFSVTAGAAGAAAYSAVFAQFVISFVLLCVLSSDGKCAVQAFAHLSYVGCPAEVWSIHYGSGYVRPTLRNYICTWAALSLALRSFCRFCRVGHRDVCLFRLFFRFKLPICSYLIRDLLLIFWSCRLTFPDHSHRFQWILKWNKYENRRQLGRPIIDRRAHTKQKMHTYQS